MCPTLKKLSNRLQPYRDVKRLINEILMDSKNGSKTRTVEHLLSFAGHQFGKGVTGKHYRERGDGERISNWEVEIEILHQIIRPLCDIYQQDNSLSTIIQNDMKFPNLEQSLSLLNPWVIHLDSDPSNGINDLSKEQIDTLLYELYFTEQNMAAIATDRRQFDLAEEHCQRCLAYSRRYGSEGERKITITFIALRNYCYLRGRQHNCSDAVTFAEECYNLVVEAYDPVHPQVQKAAGILIDILISKGDLFDAERYAQVTYGNLRDKKNGMDQESAAVAEGAYNLANVIYQQDGDLIKAEELARESLRIGSLINDHHSVGRTCGLLANILRVQSKLGDETRGMYEYFLAICTRSQGPDGSHTATGNYNLGRFHHMVAHEETTVDLKQSQLLLAKSYCEESHRIYLKIYGPTHQNTVNATSQLAFISSELSKISLPPKPPTLNP
jgi:tetratricopeptide (TPR) repeat protein